MATPESIVSPPQHPGTKLARIIKEMGKTDAWLADQAELSRPLLSQITNCNRRITSRTAQKICEVIGGDPLDWLKLQREFDLHVETQKVLTLQDAHGAHPDR